VAFEFRDEAGQVHQGTTSLGRAEWERLQPGDRLAVIYLRTEPSVYRLARPAWGTIGVGLAVGVFGGLMGLGGVALVLRRVAAINEQVRLVTTGQPVLGLIDAVQEVKGSKGSVTYTLAYRYLPDAGDPSARVRNGTCERLSWRAPSWQPGGPILVLVDPDDPERHAADLFDARPDDLARLCRADDPA
jgi:hypothetical protein